MGFRLGDRAVLRSTGRLLWHIR